MRRIVKATKNLCSELSKISRVAADRSSFLRLATDFLWFRALRWARPAGRDRERRVRLRGDVRLTYRLNRGDIQSIREVWLDEAYRLPFESTHDVLVDLGANIGLTTVWLAKRYGFSTIIAVEPAPSNARLTRLNLADNQVHAQVIEAAVGPTDGTVCFEESAQSNLGRVGAAGTEVAMLSMSSVLSRLPEGTKVDLVKLDIEGGEGPLLRGDLAWLARVHAIIAEFHPPVIDYPGAIQTLRDAGFQYLAAGSAHPDSMDTFVRPS